MTDISNTSDVDDSEDMIQDDIKSLEYKLSEEEKHTSAISVNNSRELESNRKLNKKLTVKVNELTALVAVANYRDKDQLQKISSLEKEINDLERRIAQATDVAAQTSDLYVEMLQDNELMRERLRKLTKSANDLRGCRERAVAAEVLLLKFKCDYDTALLKHKLKEATESIERSREAIDRHGSANSTSRLRAWQKYQNDWNIIAHFIECTISKTKGEYDRLIELILTGDRSFDELDPVVIPAIPASPKMPQPLEEDSMARQKGLEASGSSSQTAPLFSAPFASASSAFSPPRKESNFQERSVQSPSELQQQVARLQIARSTASSPTSQASSSNLPSDIPTAGAEASGGSQPTRGRSNAQKLFEAVQLRLPGTDRKTISATVTKLRDTIWGGTLPKNMNVIIAAVVQSLSETSQPRRRSPVWGNQQNQSVNMPRDVRSILRSGQYECKICLNPCVLKENNLLICPAAKCQEPYHRECVNEWLASKSDCPNCRQIWVSANDFPSLYG